MQVNGVYIFGIVNILEGIKYYNANEEIWENKTTKQQPATTGRATVVVSIGFNSSLMKN